MASFGKAIPVILAHEGTPQNFWVNDPDDAGGETVWGISRLMIDREGITAADLGIEALVPGALKGVSLDTVTGLYRKFFWDRYGYGRIDDDTVATKLFDAAVNCGPAHAHSMAQLAANECGQSLKVDGSLGPWTVAGINACAPEAWLIAMGHQMASYYIARVAARPQNQKFLSTWLRRAGWGVPPPKE